MLLTNTKRCNDSDNHESFSGTLIAELSKVLILNEAPTSLGDSNYYS